MRRLDQESGLGGQRVGRGTRNSEKVSNADSQVSSFIPSPQTISTHALMLNVQIYVT